MFVKKKKVLKCKKNIQTDTQPQVEYVQAVQMIFVFFCFWGGGSLPLRVYFGCASIRRDPLF